MLRPLRCNDVTPTVLIVSFCLEPITRQGEGEVGCASQHSPRKALLLRHSHGKPARLPRRDVRVPSLIPSALANTPAFCSSSCSMSSAIVLLCIRGLGTKSGGSGLPHRFQEEQLQQHRERTKARRTKAAKASEANERCWAQWVLGPEHGGAVRQREGAGEGHPDLFRRIKKKG